MFRYRNKLILQGCFVASLLGTTMGCHHKPEARNEIVPVRVAKLGGPGAEGGARFSATVRPDTQVDLAFKSSGYVEEILQLPSVNGTKRNVQEGDEVKKGAVLARVRESDFQNALTETQAAMNKTKGDFQRAAQLYENGSVSKADYDAAFAAMTSAKARYQQAQTALHDTRLVAPMDGVVLKRSVEVGALATPGSPAFTIANTRSVKVVFGVPDTMVAKMKAGAPQAVVVGAVPDQEFRGLISRVAASADPTSRDFDIEVTIPNPKALLKVGMIASLKVDTGTPAQPGGARVPIGAVVRPKGDPHGYGVFVVEEKDGKAFARLHKITPGDLVGNDVAVSEGVKDGDTIIVSGNTLVQDGQQVRVVP